MTGEGGPDGLAWYALVYGLPSEPGRYRTGVCRRLRASGAVCPHNGVASLPVDPAGGRTMRGVVREILEVEGTTRLLQGSSVDGRGELGDALAGARGAGYREVPGRCRDLHAESDGEGGAGDPTFAGPGENEEDLTKLEAWVGEVRARDRFGAPLCGEAGRAPGAFAASAYEAADPGPAGSS